MVIRLKSDIGVQICTPLSRLRLYKFVHFVLGGQICTNLSKEGCTNLYKPIRGGVQICTNLSEGVYKFVHPNNNASDLVQIFLDYA